MKKSLRQNLRNLNEKNTRYCVRCQDFPENLYNRHLYEVRQHFFDNGEYLNYYNTYNSIKDNGN